MSCGFTAARRSAISCAIRASPRYERVSQHARTDSTHGGSAIALIGGAGGRLNRLRRALARSLRQTDPRARGPNSTSQETADRRGPIRPDRVALTSAQALAAIDPFGNALDRVGRIITVRQSTGPGALRITGGLSLTPVSCFGGKTSPREAVAASPRLSPCQGSSLPAHGLRRNQALWKYDSLSEGSNRRIELIVRTAIPRRVRYPGQAPNA